MTDALSYSETISLLYSGNTFVISEPDCIEYLPRLILRQRINTISSLRFQWEFNGDPPVLSLRDSLTKGMRFKKARWITIWKILAEMEALQDLRVMLKFGGPSWDNMSDEDLNALLVPLLAITRPQNFDLRIPFYPRRRVAPWDALPCNIWSRREMIEGSGS
jgi:hypothetical protein